MTADERAEMTALQRKLHEFLNSLVIAGFGERVVVASVLVAATERVLMASTPTQTAAWLRGQALNVEKHGAALKAAIEQVG